MSQELKTYTINMKSLDQDITSPVIAGAGDVNGATLRVVFTQKAEHQLTRNTKVYLNWMHQEQRVKGYNVFTKVNECPPIWEIHWPRAMLYEGTALCRIEVVDDISIAPSNNFTVHILQNPNDGSSFVVSDDYSVFEQAVLDMNNLADEMRDEFEFQKHQFDSMYDTLEEISNKADEALDKANEALNRIGSITSSENAYGLYITEI